MTTQRAFERWSGPCLGRAPFGPELVLDLPDGYQHRPVVVHRRRPARALHRQAAAKEVSTELLGPSKGSDKGCLLISLGPR